MRAAALAVAVVLAGCRYGPTFTCEDSSQCSAGGSCGSDGLCTVPDASCPSGHRYEDYSGDLSGLCVGEVPADLHVGFQFPSSLTDEAAGIHTVAVVLDAAATTQVTLDLEASGGTAELGVDYSLETTTVTFEVGQTTAGVELVIVADGSGETDETIELTLLRPVGATLAQATHVVTISETVLPRVQFTASTSSAPEDMTTMQGFDLVLDTPAAADVLVGYGVAGTATAADHDLVTGILIIPAGQTSARLPVTVVADLLDEDDETIDVTLTAVGGAVLGPTAVHSHTIVDDDPAPSVSFSSVTASSLENTGTTTLQAVLSAPSGKPIAFSVASSGTATAGADYQVQATPFAIAPGQTLVGVPVNVLDDALDEDDETVVLTFTNLVNVTPGAVASQAVTIVDEDPTPSLSFNPAENDGFALEGSGGGSFDWTYHVILTAISGRAVSVDLAVGGTANSVDGSVSPAPAITLPAGTTSATVTVSVNQDNQHESNDRFVLTLSNPVNATLAAPTTRVHTIVNDD